MVAAQSFLDYHRFPKIMLTGFESAMLLQALTAIQTAVQQRLSGLLHAVAAPASGLATLDFLGGSLLPEVDEAVSHRLPGRF